MIPLHAQVCADRADELRWVLSYEVLGFTGPVATLPDPLRGLLTDGTLSSVRAEPRAVVTRLGLGRAWSAEGARVRTALQVSLAEPDGWRPEQDAVTQTEDERLLAAAEELIAGRVGQLARSHGGLIALVGAGDGVVEVRLTGACHGCPAATVTLRVRLERELRERCPWLREVREVGADAREARSRPWISAVARQSL